MSVERKIVVKSSQRAGKGVAYTSYGELEVRVSRIAGMSGFTPKIEGQSKGVSRLSAEEAWLWLSEYLSLPLEVK